MSRPLRLEFAGALYHVTARGDRQQAIYRDDTDRLAWLDLLARICERYKFTVHSFCQMTNHYHLLIETGEANLSHGMRQLNGSYSQYFNRRHDLVGHVFQGRYVAVLVQKENYLLELARYIVLNPLRAGMVTSSEAWPWSSYAYMLQRELPPPWLETRWILSQFGETFAEAIEAYKLFVVAGIGLTNPIKSKRHQLLLGDDAFVDKHRAPRAPELLTEVTRQHRRALVLSLADYQMKYADRDLAIAEAYFSTAYTMTEIAAHFGISYRTVSRIVRKIEALQPRSCAIGRTDPG
jgi:REP element-mobilizing transposase RayT/AraC-like DNA-binding protein